MTTSDEEKEILRMIGVGVFVFVSRTWLGALRQCRRPVFGVATVALAAASPAGFEGVASDGRRGSVSDDGPTCGAGIKSDFGAEETE